MPRLPQPTLALKGHHGRLLEPLPLTGPVGLRPTSYRPVTKRVLRPPPLQGSPTPRPPCLPGTWTSPSLRVLCTDRSTCSCCVPVPPQIA